MAGYNLYYDVNGNWEIIPGDETTNCFDSEEEAWDVVESLRDIGPEWAECEYAVRPCTHPRHTQMTQ